LTDNQTVSAVVVGFSDPEATRHAVESLLGQSDVPIEILVLDNHPAAPTAAAMSGWPDDPRVRLLHSGSNLGYTRACNKAAHEARGEWLFFLNPDAHADPGCLRTMLQAADDMTGVVGAQVLLPDGRTNAGDNPLHISGLAWSGGLGEPREHGAPRTVATVSGAALLARTRVFRELGGMCDRFFLYQDDVDLCWRMRLASWRVLFCPEAIAWHDYEFERGERKWYWLERNRLWSVLSNYSVLSLLLLGPLLLGTEMAVAALALRQGWGASLLRAWGSTIRSLPELLRWRRSVQRTRRVPDSELVALMTARFEPALLKSPAALRVAPLMEIYRRAVLRVLRATGR
jgi:GT2 family glycosyltransferase